MNKILVAEDNEHEREGLRTLLKKAGFTVKVAADGMEAPAASKLSLAG
jgi:CheY-like chemotaxis protein